jgi:hypothetical protein
MNIDKLLRLAVYLLALIGACTIVWWMDRNAPRWWFPTLTLVAIVVMLAADRLNRPSRGTARQYHQATRPDCAVGLSLASTPQTPPRRAGHRAPTFH